MPSISKTELYGTPVLSVTSSDPAYGAVYGAIRMQEFGCFVFPAFHPFLEFVLHDLEMLAELGHELDSGAQDWIAKQRQIPDLIQNGYLDPRFDFVTKPYDHQREAVVFGVHNLRSGLLLDPGLGKTKCAIDIIRHDRLSQPVKTLVICPVVMLYKTATEVTFHSGGELKPVVIDGTPKKKLKLIESEGDVYIATYGTVTSDSTREALLNQLDYKILVVDESHNLQTHNSAKTLAVTEISRKAPRRIIMSGTATLGDPRHLWGQLSVLAPFLNDKNYFKFCQRYIHYGDDRRRVVLGFRNLRILNKKLHLVSVRRTKEEALDLPPMTFITLPYSLSKEQKKLYNDFATSSLSELESKLNIIEEATPAARLTKMQQLLSGFMWRSRKDPRICDNCKYMAYCVTEKIRPYTPACSVVPDAPAPDLLEFENPKLDALRELLEMLLVDPSNKVVIWAKFLKELDYIEDVLTELGIGYKRVDGSLSAAEVREAVNHFQTDPSCRVYAGQVATGIGIDLVAANYMIYFSLTWNLGEHLQALARFHRIGQYRNVTVYSLIYPRSVEEAVYGALQAKEDISEALLNPDYDGESTFARKITRPSEIS